METIIYITLSSQSEKSLPHKPQDMGRHIFLWHKLDYWGNPRVLTENNGNKIYYKCYELANYILLLFEK